MSRRRRPDRFLAFGRESVHGPLEPLTLTVPVLVNGQQTCDVCAVILELDEQTIADHDADGYPLYVCALHADAVMPARPEPAPELPAWVREQLARARARARKDAH